MADERELAALIAQYYRREIGVLMHQAQHWSENGKPLAVHHRVMAADNMYQIVSLMERDVSKGWTPPFDTMRSDLARENKFADGVYPPTMELHRYRDCRFVVRTLDALERKAG
jgi:hypothetical protein